MKKLFILALTSTFLLTGCGATETLSCEYRNTTNGTTTKINYDIDHQDEEIKKVRITYNYDFNNTTDTARDTTINGTTNHTDGVGTGTDGTTNDTNLDKDGIVDGVVGSVIDTIVGGVTGVILDSAGLRDKHKTVQTTYGNVNGFSVQNTNDANNNYRVTYVIDYDTISDDDLTRFNLSRNFNSLRNTYVNQGFTCK